MCAPLRIYNIIAREAMSTKYEVPKITAEFDKSTKGGIFTTN